MIDYKKAKLYHKEFNFSKDYERFRALGDNQEIDKLINSSELEAYRKMKQLSKSLKKISHYLYR
jgi:hypothetical protein